MTVETERLPELSRSTDGLPETEEHRGRRREAADLRGKRVFSEELVTDRPRRGEAAGNPPRGLPPGTGPVDLRAQTGDLPREHVALELAPPAKPFDAVGPSVPDAAFLRAHSEPARKRSSNPLIRD